MSDDLVSLNMRQAAYAQDTGHFPIFLITLNHDDLATPIYISSDPTARLSATTDTDVVYGTISNGIEYIFLPIMITLPSDKEEGAGEMVLEFDNIHRTYVETIRSISEPASVTIDQVMSNDLDTIELTWPEFFLTKVEWDTSTIKATCSIEDAEREPFPCGVFSPSYFPGLF